MSRQGSATIAALAAVGLWSTVATAFKLGLSVMQPLQLLFVATLVSALLFAIAATWTRSWQLSRRNISEAALFGLANPLCYYLILFEAYDRLPAQITQPLNYTWAIALALFAVPILGQELTRRTMAGIALSYAGVLVLLSQGKFTTIPQTDWLGVALALASTVVWAGYWLANARSKTEPLALMALSFACALPVIAALCALGPGWPQLSWEVAAYGTWVGLFEMGVTFLLWQRAMRLTSSAATTGQLIFLSPFVSLVLIWAVLGETIHATSIIGLAIIVAGIILARRPSAA
ncbi:MAG: DMT family transporter [Rhizobiales bacterium]|nr:DMT family transporter [Hyphomicrobiales bacterium]